MQMDELKAELNEKYKELEWIVSFQEVSSVQLECSYYVKLSQAIIHLNVKMDIMTYPFSKKLGQVEILMCPYCETVANTIVQFFKTHHFRVKII